VTPLGDATVDHDLDAVASSEQRGEAAKQPLALRSRDDEDVG
jgi:hypothetical protein